MDATALHRRLGQALLGLALCLGVGAVRAGASDAPGITPQRILLGQSAKLSGPGGTLIGQTYRAGFLLVFNAVNRAGGVHGRRIELITLDDRIDADQARENTRQLVERHRVFALVGHTFTNTVKAALPLVRAHDVPFVAPYTGFAELYDGSLRQVFVLRASFDDELAALVHHVETVGDDELALVHYANPLGQALRDDVQRRLASGGRTLQASESMPLSAPDSAAAARRVAADLARHCPKVVMLGVSGRDAAELVRALKSVCGSVRFLARGLVDISLLMRELGDAARGIRVTQVVPNPTRGVHPLSAGYREALAARDPSARPDFTEFEGYIAATMIVQALRAAGPAPTRPSFMKALEAQRLGGPGHYRLEFAPGGRVASRYVNLVMISEGGRLTD